MSQEGTFCKGMPVRETEGLSSDGQRSDEPPQEIKDTPASSFRVRLHFRDIRYHALIDTGAGIGLIASNVLGTLPLDLVQECKTDDITLKNANGVEMPVLGKYNVTFLFNNLRKITHTFVVTSFLAEDIILGMDFIMKYNMTLDSTNKVVSYYLKLVHFQQEELERAGGGDWEKFVRKAMQKILSPPLMKKLIFLRKKGV